VTSSSRRPATWRDATIEVKDLEGERAKYKPHNFTWKPTLDK
jgi:hypothetical protein